MGGILRKLAYLVVGVVALFVVAAVLVSLLFDPNDYRDDVAEAVKRETGRDLVIEGDIDLTFFPWFGVSIGRTTLGNAPGFGDEPFLSFDDAQASLMVMSLIRGDGIEVGNIVLDSFALNLQVDERGRNNWSDMAEHSAGQEEAADDPADHDGAGEASDDADGGQDITLSVASVEITNAAVSYTDAQTGESYRLTNFNLETGRIASSDPIDISSRFDFDLQPAGIAGDFSIETAIVPADDGIMLDDARISALGIDATVSNMLDADGFTVRVDAFSLKSLMTRLGIEPPVTADPDALGKIAFEGTVALGQGITVDGVTLVVDDTTFTGGLTVADGGAIAVRLAGDSMDVDRYMEPAADAEAASGDAVPVEIPVDLIRALNVRGEMTLDTARLSGLEFADIDLGLNVADGNLRLHPVAAGLFGGRYSGDVRINAAGNVPVLSVNESITGVDLGKLAAAMFEQANVTGSINGSFKLGGSGADLAAIQRGLNGNITVELLDGTWEGTDVWYEMRRARALYKQEPAPEPTLPARTAFSNVKASGPVVDGVFRNDVLSAELPFMRLAGKGQVDIPAGTVDYRMTASFLGKSALDATATEEELQDFSGAEIPFRVTGPMTAPKIAPDIEKMLKDEVKEKVEEEIKDQLKKLLGGDD